LSQRTKAELLLVTVTMVWGCTFVVVKSALSLASPMPFLAARFTLAGLLLVLVLSRGRMDLRALFAGGILGVSLFAGYAFQTWGLVYTTPSKSAFITGFAVVLVPFLQLFHGFHLRAATVLGALLGFAGIYFLVLPSGIDSVNRGDILTLFGAISFAVHIVLVGGYIRRHSFRHLVPVQVLTAGALATLALPFDRELRMDWSWGLVAAVLVTALLATGFAFSVQNWAQQFTPPAHTALIFSLEPVFAALTSRLVLDEHLGGKILVGAALILGGMVVSELWGGTAPAPVEG
jgi:drug/metabolite transporter (DMT)-like permease